MSYIDEMQSLAKDVEVLNDFYEKGYIDLEEFVKIRDKIVDKVISISSDEKSIKDVDL